MNNFVVLNRPTSQMTLNRTILINVEIKTALIMLDLLCAALRNPNKTNANELDNYIRSTLANANARAIFEIIEREIKRQNVSNEFKIRKNESDAFFTYASAGKTEEKFRALFDLQQDVKKSAEAILILDANAEKMSESQLSKIIALMEREELKKDDIASVLGKTPFPELADAIYLLIRKQEAAAIAAQNFLDLDRNECQKIFGIEPKNEIFSLLTIYRKIVGDAKFAKIRESAMYGNLAAILAEIKKMGLMAQYIFFVLLAPHLIRNGMWNSAILGIFFKTLREIDKTSQKVGTNSNKMQIRYMHKLKKFLSKFADFKGINFSMFSSAFLSALK